MRWLINRYSYLIFSTLALSGATALAFRLGGIAGPATVFGVGAALAAAQVGLRGRKGVETWSEVQALIRGGRPSLLFIYADT